MDKFTINKAAHHPIDNGKIQKDRIILTDLERYSGRGIRVHYEGSIFTKEGFLTAIRKILRLVKTITIAGKPYIVNLNSLKKLEKTASIVLIKEYKFAKNSPDVIKKSKILPIHFINLLITQVRQIEIERKNAEAAENLTKNLLPSVSLKKTESSEIRNTSISLNFPFSSPDRSNNTLEGEVSSLIAQDAAELNNESIHNKTALKPFNKMRNDQDFSLSLSYAGPGETTIEIDSNNMTMNHHAPSPIHEVTCYQDLLDISSDEKSICELLVFPETETLNSKKSTCSNPRKQNESDLSIEITFDEGPLDLEKYHSDYQRILGLISSMLREDQSKTKENLPVYFSQLLEIMTFNCFSRYKEINVNESIEVAEGINQLFSNLATIVISLDKKIDPKETTTDTLIETIMREFAQFKEKTHSLFTSIKKLPFTHKLCLDYLKPKKTDLINYIKNPSYNQLQTLLTDYETKQLELVAATNENAIYLLAKELCSQLATLRDAHSSFFDNLPIPDEETLKYKRFVQPRAEIIRETGVLASAIDNLCSFASEFSTFYRNVYYNEREIEGRSLKFYSNMQILKSELNDKLDLLRKEHIKLLVDKLVLFVNKAPRLNEETVNLPELLLCFFRTRLALQESYHLYYRTAKVDIDRINAIFSSYIFCSQGIEELEAILDVADKKNCALELIKKLNSFNPKGSFNEDIQYCLIDTETITLLKSPMTSPNIRATSCFTRSLLENSLLDASENSSILNPSTFLSPIKTIATTDHSTTDNSTAALRTKQDEVQTASNLTSAVILPQDSLGEVQAKVVKPLILDSIPLCSFLSVFDKSKTKRILGVNTPKKSKTTPTSTTSVDRPTQSSTNKVKGKPQQSLNPSPANKKTIMKGNPQSKYR